jgi:glycosyltransferase involved in cell wall biosynthesis
VKVLALVADQGGCMKYRLGEPVRVVTEQFPEIDVRIATEGGVEAEVDVRTGIVTVQEVTEDVDLIIVQRPLNNAFRSMLKQARRQGIATIVELDDDFHSIHPKNAAYRAVQPEVDSKKNKEWLRKTALEADLLTCSTPVLSKYNPERYEVLPNYVPESIFEIGRPERAVPVVGWTGSMLTHPTDLQVTRGQVGKVVAQADVPFFVVGDSRGVREALKLTGSTLLSDSGWVPLDEYYQRISAHIDVGIVPLERSDFNTAKSWLKGLEFAALGIPFVASATPEYEALAARGVGRTAFDHQGFRYILRQWLNDPAQARADGARYRDIVKAEFTYEQHADSWVKAWERAIDIRKKASK